MDVVSEILGLITQPELSDTDTAKLTELYASLTDDQLVDVEAGLLAKFDEAHAEGVTAESLGLLSRIADHVDGVRFVAGERITAAEEAAAQAAAEEAERAAQLEALMSRVHASTPDPDDGDDPEDPPAEPEPETAAEVVAEAEQILEETPEPVTAAAPASAPARPAARSAIAARTPAARQARPKPQPRVTIQAAGGGEFPDVLALEKALLRRQQDFRGMGPQADGDHRVASFVTHYPDAYVLRQEDVDDIAQEIQAKVSEPGGTATLTADGGICGPVQHLYDHLPYISQASRPLKAAVTNYNAARGGISWTSAFKFTDILAATTPTVGNAIGVITEAQDAAATYDKSVQRVTCGTQTELRVDAIYKQLEFGNFMARSNPERTAAFTEASLAAFARFTEQRIYNKMLALTTEVNAPQKLGAARDFLTAMNRAAINYRARNRMDPNATLDTIIPAWVGMGLLPDDQTNALQSYPEQFEVTAAWVEARLAQRNIRVINWFQDDFTTSLSSGGGLNNYPSSFKAMLFHPGAFVIIDQGTLDLGVVRDSTLNASNLFRTFMEEFWNVGMWGVEAQSIEFALCANGASAGSRTPTCGS